MQLGSQQNTSAGNSASRTGTSRPRPVLVRTLMATTMKVMSNRTNLKGTDIFFNDDLSRPEQQLQRKLVPLYKELRKNGTRCHLFNMLVLWLVNTRELGGTSLPIYSSKLLQSLRPAQTSPGNLRAAHQPRALYVSSSSYSPP